MQQKIYIYTFIFQWEADGIRETHSHTHTHTQNAKKEPIGVCTCVCSVRAVGRVGGALSISKGRARTAAPSDQPSVYIKPSSLCSRTRDPRHAAFVLNCAIRDS